PLLNDTELVLAYEPLRLPTFQAAGSTLYRRVTFCVDAGTLRKAFYPRFPPDRNAAVALEYLRSAGRDRRSVSSAAVGGSRPGMALIGFHASHEQIPPSTLLTVVGLAEEAGFQAAMCSDHFAPWGAAQGNSGHAWTWLGAALQATSLGFGVVTAPGARYH